MLRLAALLYSIIATTLAGSAVVVVLALGWFSVPAIIASAAGGCLAAAPVAWLVARRIVAGRSAI